MLFPTNALCTKRCLPAGISSNKDASFSIWTSVGPKFVCSVPFSSKLWRLSALFCAQLVCFFLQSLTGTWSFLVWNFTWSNSLTFISFFLMRSCKWMAEKTKGGQQQMPSCLIQTCTHICICLSQSFPLTLLCWELNFNRLLFHLKSQCFTSFLLLIMLLFSKGSSGKPGVAPDNFFLICSLIC